MARIPEAVTCCLAEDEPKFSEGPTIATGKGPVKINYILANLPARCGALELFKTYQECKELLSEFPDLQPEDLEQALAFTALSTATV